MNALHKTPSLQALDLNLLRAFDVVYRERNLTRAAERLFLTPSAVSHALARLREAFGGPLFVREGRGVAPTPLAERLAPRVREGLALLQGALQGAAHFDPAQDLGQVTLAMHDELEPSVLPPFAKALAARAPGARLSSVRLERTRLARDLASGRVDLAVDVAQPVAPEVAHRVLVRDAFCVVSGRKRRLTPAAYLAARHVTVSSRPTGLAVEDLMLSRQGHQRDVAVRCQHYEAAFRLVADSDLLLTVPRHRAASLGAALGNHLLPLPLPLPPVELHLYWHRQAEEDPRSRWLRQELLAAAGDRKVQRGSTGR
ncbi:LysR family transcriptional regulator [Aggregicoccus sp. 17bor-14]|uniref:LysR family transcriptional regulator n=1 Tax=Myxococcaceae TaxID=31 RepID=UPI00129C6BE8|nr:MULTISPECIES: LysR family transcriptional regulator [Myxococcaceae]MBF5042906.1 LysR family transcriptional regulator [Simulacricoccus sp. 17bor-14]MRI88673.1 LysR family transcriptional regulator [Aggregicoccus sp. 17bor-14]